MGDELSQEIYVGNLLKNTGAETPNGEAKATESGHNHEELQSIVNHLVKIPEEHPAPRAANITRITHHEISVMRATQSNLPEVRAEQAVKQKTSFSPLDAFFGLFKMQEKRSRCDSHGHECKHCGRVIKVEDAVAAATRGH